MPIRGRAAPSSTDAPRPAGEDPGRQSMVFQVPRDGHVRAGAPAKKKRAGSGREPHRLVPRRSPGRGNIHLGRVPEHGERYPEDLAVGVLRYRRRRSGVAGRISAACSSPPSVLALTQGFVFYSPKSPRNHGPPHYVRWTRTSARFWRLRAAGPGPFAAWALVIGGQRLRAGEGTERSHHPEVVAGKPALRLRADLRYRVGVAARVPKNTAFAAVHQLRSTVLAVSGVLAVVLLAALALLARSLRQRELAETTTRRLRVEAERARTDAEQANRAKSEFLSLYESRVADPTQRGAGLCPGARVGRAPPTRYGNSGLRRSPKAAGTCSS